MKLENIIKDKERLFFNNDIPKEYLKDDYLGKGSLAHALIFIKSHTEVVDIAKYAYANKIPMIAIGSKTGLAGATLTMGNEILLDFSQMDKILKLDEETMTLTVEPGVKLETVQKYLEEKDFFYPPDPGSKNSTIGGNVATNAGGMRAIKYGVTRDYVKEIQVVLADGEVLNLGSLNVKDSSGYDIKDLFIGSEGTLGITTLIKLKILPLPQNIKSYTASFVNLSDATKVVPKIIHENIDPTAIEFFEREMLTLTEKDTGIKFPSDKGNAFLLITLDGPQIEKRASKLKELLLNNHCVDFITLDTKELSKKVWSLRDGLLKAVVNYSEQVTMDETVPINYISSIYEYTKELEQEYDTKLMSFGHAGDGNLHTCIIRGANKTDIQWQKDKNEILDKLYQRIKDYGGLPSAEHGIGLIKKDHFLKFMDPTYISYMRKIKKVFDEYNLMNPHKVI